LIRPNFFQFGSAQAMHLFKVKWSKCIFPSHSGLFFSKHSKFNDVCSASWHNVTWMFTRI